MSETLRDLLRAFDALSSTEQQQMAAEILRRSNQDVAAYPCSSISRKKILKSGIRESNPSVSIGNAVPGR